MTQATLPFADDTPSTVAPQAADRCGFGLGWDHARHGLLPPAQHLLPQNPLRDLRVRRAISMAINRRALAERVMEGGATATGQIAAPGFIGHVPNLPLPPFDPPGARAYRSML